MDNLLAPIALGDHPVRSGADYVAVLEGSAAGFMLSLPLRHISMAGT
jgi:hypothetical protein